MIAAIEIENQVEVEAMVTKVRVVVSEVLGTNTSETSNVIRKSSLANIATYIYLYMRHL